MFIIGIKGKLIICFSFSFSGLWVIIGRGAIDCKSLASLWLSILIYLKKKNIKTNKGIVFAATSDEENDGLYGSKYLIRNEDTIKSCKYVIGEGGGFPLQYGEKTYYTCQTDEKGAYVYKSHSAIEGLKYGQTFNMGSSTANIFSGLVKSKAYNMKLLGLLARQKFKKDQAYLDTNSIIQSNFIYDDNNCISISCCSGVDKTQIEKFLQKLKTDINRLELIKHVKATHTPINTELYKVIQEETEKINPRIKLVPHITPGYSDNRIFRDEGKTVYGFFPLSINERVSTIHNHNEFISIEGLKFSFELLKNIVIKFCCK